MHAISSLLEKDVTQRIGAISFESFASNPFFEPIDFEALERKEVEPIFIPSQDKTNFDATYDLEELLLEEAPLEARARRQKPREQLREDATAQEIRADELHKMIETLFEPFDYTLAPEERNAMAGDSTPNSAVDPSSPSATHRPIDATVTTTTTTASRTSTQSPNGSPPIPTNIPIHSNTDHTGAITPSHTPSPQMRAQDPMHASGAYRGDSQSFSRPIPNKPHHQQPQPQQPQQQQQHSHIMRGSSRSVTNSGGVQVVLSETGSWRDLNNQSQMIPPDERAGKASGVLGFLGRKKGRDRSPKARERGVLGKEGARVIVGSG